MSFVVATKIYNNSIMFYQVIHLYYLKFEISCILGLSLGNDEIIHKSRINLTYQFNQCTSVKVVYIKTVAKVKVVSSVQASGAIKTGK